MKKYRPWVARFRDYQWGIYHVDHPAEPIPFDDRSSAEAAAERMNERSNGPQPNAKPKPKQLNLFD